MPEEKKFTYSPKRPEDLAAKEFLASRSPAELSVIARDFKASEQWNSPENWNEHIKEEQGRFAAVPKKEHIPKIREILGIEEFHKVLVAPVYSGEWSQIHKDSIGVDFAEEALKNHPNNQKYQADLRNLPFPDNYVDHIVMFEPTPLRSGTASPEDILRTLWETARVSRGKIHIIQRAKGEIPIWSHPFLLKYMENLGVRYEIKDITEHTEVDPRFSIKYNVVSLSIASKHLKAHRDIIQKDIVAAKRFMDLIRENKMKEAFEELEKNASPALRKAIYHTYLAWRAEDETVPVHEMRENKKSF
jgi:ubiquinone/menaquinone biosynthesis C-methylase UbiE